MKYHELLLVKKYYTKLNTNVTKWNMCLFYNRRCVARNVCPREVRDELAQIASASLEQENKDGYDAIFNALPVPLTHVPDFVPMFFDVEGDGSCFFYSLTYTTPQPSTPTNLHTTAFGPNTEYAHDIRRKAVNLIRDVIKSHILEHDLCIESVHADSSLYDLCRSSRSIINEILTSGSAILFPDDMVEKLETYHHIIEERIQRMSQPDFWVNNMLGMYTARVFPYLIVSVTVPHSWVLGVPSTRYEQNMGCFINDIGPGGDFADLHDPPTKTIFILYNGAHYMRVLFLNTDYHSTEEMKIIDRVDSWDRARWLEKIAMYWGFPQSWWGCLAMYKRKNRCLYRVNNENVCSLPLGHTGSHSFH